MSDTTQPARGWPPGLAGSRHQAAQAALAGPADAKAWSSVTSPHLHLFARLTPALAPAFFQGSQAAGTWGKWVSRKGVWQLLVWCVLISHGSEAARCQLTVSACFLAAQLTLSKEGEEVVANRSLHTSNFENEVCLLWAFTSFLIHQTEKRGKGKRKPHKTTCSNFKLRIGYLATWIWIVAWPVPRWPQGSCSTSLNLSVFFSKIMLKTCKGLAG